MPSNKRDKTTGLPLPSPVVPATSICFQISVPNALEYRSALKGALSTLGQAWTWSQTVGQDNPDAFTAAELWRERIANSLYLIDCESTVDCNDIAVCINTNAAVQRAIGNQVNQSATPGVTATPGVPMTNAQYTAQLNPMDGCDLDVLWAQCTQLVDYVISAGFDTLEIIETYSNAVEAAQFIEMVPILGTLFDELQIDQVLEFIDWTVEVMAELFAAADTPTRREEIACAIFCRCKPDCKITIERLWEVENERLGGILNPSELDTLGELANAMVTLGTNPALPLDVWFAFLIGSAKLAGYLGVRGIDASLNLLLKLAMNDANNDWELLCLDCYDPPLTECDDLKAGQQGYVPVLTGRAVYDPGEGYGAGYVNPSYLWVMKEITGFTLTKVILKLNRLMAEGTDYNVSIYPYNDVGQTSPIALSTDNHLEYTFGGLSVTDGLTIYVSSGALLPTDLRLIEVCYEYTTP